MTVRFCAKHDLGLHGGRDCLASESLEPTSVSCTWQQTHSNLLHAQPHTATLCDRQIRDHVDLLQARMCSARSHADQVLAKFELIARDHTEHMRAKTLPLLAPGITEM